MFALGTAPGLVLPVVIGVSTATTGAGCPYFFGCCLVQLLPVFVMPAGANRHSRLPFLYVQLYYITILENVVAADHDTIVLPRTPSPCVPLPLVKGKGDEFFERGGEAPL